MTNDSDSTDINGAEIENGIRGGPGGGESESESGTGAAAAAVSLRWDPGAPGVSPGPRWASPPALFSPEFRVCNTRPLADSTEAMLQCFANGQMIPRAKECFRRNNISQKIKKRINNQNNFVNKRLP